MFSGVVGVALQVAKTEHKEHRGWQDGDNSDQNKQEALKPARMFSKILELRTQVSYSRSVVYHLTERPQDPTPYDGVTSFLCTSTQPRRIKNAKDVPDRAFDIGANCWEMARGVPLQERPVTATMGFAILSLFRKLGIGGSNLAPVEKYLTLKEHLPE